MASSPASPTDSMSSPTPLTVLHADAASENAAIPNARMILRTIVVVLSGGSTRVVERITGRFWLSSFGCSDLPRGSSRELVLAPGDNQAGDHDQRRAEPGRRGRQRLEQQPAVERRPEQARVIHHDHACDAPEPECRGEQQLPECAGEAD